MGTLNLRAVSSFVALGSNLGNRAANIESAIEQLGRIRGITLLRRSSLLENPAVGGPPDSPPFLNAVAQVETTLPARALLDQLLAIEASLGRVRRTRWEPRIIDLDLLLYAEQVIDEPGLVVPHPSMHLRRFVLEPMCEIAPDFAHPVLKKTMRELLAELTK